MWNACSAVEEAQREATRNNQLQAATLLNDALNEHAKRFLQELQSQMMIDFIDDSEGGGPGDSGTGSGATGEQGGKKSEDGSGAGGSEGVGGTREVPGATHQTRKPRFPQILLSGEDADPASPDGALKILTDRHPPLEQDDVDRSYNVWWINTEHPYAKVAIANGGAKGAAFKAHQLAMFRDVVQREGLRFLQRREHELDLDRVENELTQISDQFLGNLPADLVRDLLG